MTRPPRLVMCVFTTTARGMAMTGRSSIGPPVVAWRITGNGAVPVSPGEDDPWFNDAVGVQLPDGRISDECGGPHDDEKSWLKSRRPPGCG